MKTLLVYGTGCPKCRKLAEAAEAAAKRGGIPYTLDKVTDIGEIVKAGVMMTPALAVDGVIKVSGRIPDAAELAAILAG
ncbi:MAG TPA: thioredoxin family protein [Candidatus Deferrimicrobiaceae bacterium]